MHNNNWIIKCTGHGAKTLVPEAGLDESTKYEKCLPILLLTKSVQNIDQTPCAKDSMEGQIVRII